MRNLFFVACTAVLLLVAKIRHKLKKKIKIKWK
jgi:hypothetical protein